MVEGGCICDREGRVGCGGGEHTADGKILDRNNNVQRLTYLVATLTSTANKNKQTKQKTPTKT